MRFWCSFLILYYTYCIYGWEIPISADGYNTKQQNLDRAINVHLVPHSHCDVGWLKTIDQYFYGSNNTIHDARVQYVLDTVLNELLQNKNRKFMWVEQAFFTRWWKKQSFHVKKQMRQLVVERRFEFVNGGWAMHDEGCTHFVGMIDQMTIGHRFLKEEFNVVPKIGWQIDTFGHSSTQAALLSAMLGFQATYFARIDYQDYEKRKENKDFEFMWRPSPSLGDASIFTGVLQDHYGPPKGFNFQTDQPIMDDTELEDFNLYEKVEEFVQVCQQRASHIKGNNIMLTMGEDFTYSNARIWFLNMDKLIHYANQDGRLNVFYSTPSQYTAARMNENITWSEKTDDFFPYAEKEHSYWTGYFTSRPALKLYAREASALLQQARQLEVFAQFQESRLDKLERAVAVVQHHDGITGTEKQHVAFDYAKRISRGIEQAEQRMQDAFSRLLNTTERTQFCRRSNVSECAFTSETPQEFTTVVYNGQGMALNNANIIIPTSEFNIKVLDAHDNAVAFDIVPNDQDLRLSTTSHTYSLLFQASIPAFGVNQYRVTASEEAEIIKPSKTSDAIFLENEHIQLIFSSNCGALESLLRKLPESNISVNISHQFLYYPSYAGFDQSSGAYIFRPSSNSPTSIGSNCPEKVEVYHGQIVQEVRQRWNGWAQQTYRLYKSSTSVEVEWTIGSIPVYSGIGKEIISRYHTSIQNENTFATDSNGREFVTRKINYRPSWDLQVNEPVAGNYYPVNTGIHIRDNEKQLTILTDRSQGGSSINNGEIELMIHRRTLYDDNKGVGEPLNEPMELNSPLNKNDGLIARGKHYLLLDKPSQAPTHYRTMMEQVFSPPVLGYLTKPISTFTASLNLPANVAIITLQLLSKQRILVRLAHKYSIDEGNQPALVFIDDLFRNTFTLLNMEEVSLTTTATVNPRTTNIPKPTKSPWEIRLQPMEIKTLLLQVSFD